MLNVGLWKPLAPLSFRDEPNRTIGHFQLRKVDASFARGVAINQALLHCAEERRKVAERRNLQTSTFCPSGVTSSRT